MISLMQDARLTALRARIPALVDAVSISPLEGGLTNTSYRIDTKSNKYVMRICNEAGNLLGIDRDNERINSKRAHEAGVGPAVIDDLPDENVLIMSWIEATTLKAKDFQSREGLLERIAVTLRRLHNGPAFEGIFHFPTIRNRYLKTVIESGYFLPDQYLAFEPLVSQLENIIAANPENLVPCNNDLLAENFLDDGTKIWIIDYEYAGQNEASFEIGNLASETGLNEEQLTALCDLYWQSHMPSKIARARAWSLIARFGWVLWASIQEAISPLSFDFRSWGMHKWNTVLTALGETNYRWILDNISHQEV
jgi:thiamine kinase-like enzyme